MSDFPLLSSRTFASLIALGALLAPACGRAQNAPAAPPAAAPAEEALDILEFVIDGNSVLPALEIERAVYRFLGPQRRFADIEAARRALEETYQRLGYQTVFVEIPEQKVQDGVIRLRVLEGRVDRTRVTGARYFSLGEIRTRVTELDEGAVPDFYRMQDQLAQLNRTPDRQVAPVLRAGRTPGTVEVDLAVKDELPLHGDLEVNNRASAFTTDTRVNAGLRYENLWQRQHSFGLNWQVSPEATSEVNVVYGTYLWRFAESSNVVALYGVRSNSRIALVGSATVLGKATIGGARWIIPLAADRGYLQSFTLGIDHKDFAQTNVSAQTGEADPLPGITYNPLLFGYSGNWLRETGALQVSLTLATAPRGLLGNRDSAFRARRSEASASYVALKYDTSYEHGFGKHFGAWARLEGQWTENRLIPNEQASAGGAESVRGYRESEFSADRMLRGSVEARWYPLGRPGLPTARSMYALLFVDAADLRSVQPRGPELRSAQIVSVGLGVRLSNWWGLRLSGDAAYTLRDGSRSTSGLVTEGDTWRFLFNLGYGF